MKARTVFGYVASICVSLAVGYYIGRTSYPPPDLFRSVSSTARSVSVTASPTKQLRIASAEKKPSKTVVTSAPKTVYVLNKTTKKFHKESCASVKQIKETNKEIVDWSRSEIINKGYDPCGRCNP
jgi:maltose-binding protein MalE